MTAAGEVLVAAAALAWLAWLVRAGLVAARIFQIEEYEPARLLAWARLKSWSRPPAVLWAAVVCAGGALAGLLLPDAVARDLAAGAWLGGTLLLHLMWRPPRARKRLVATGRVRRLGAAAVAPALALTAAPALTVWVWPRPGGLAAVALVAAGPWLSALVLVAAGRLAEPVEALVRRRYLGRARARIRAASPTIVAVAGSYGKTGTKHILASLLEPHLPVLATPRSYNTLMGVTRAVNELLRPEHRALLVEMDAYRGGEIADLCRLCPPRLGIVTAVGPQHLERFGSLEAIAAAIFELVAALPEDGVAVVYSGDQPSRALARRAAAVRPTVTYALEPDDPAADVQVRGLRMDPRGASFEWRWPARSLSRELTCPLLGRHNALNAAAALAAVECLGLPLGPSLEAVAGLSATEHRLQPMPATGGLTVIDDSYNANPVGVHNALEVLETFDAASRILVTPGLVELGAVQAVENRRFGRRAAAVCDHVVVVRSREGADLEAGLREGGLPASRLHLVASLDEATATIGRIAQARSVVLFCNDLPDPYLFR